MAMERVQPDLKKRHPGRFLYAEDIGDKLVTVTIGRPYNDPELAKAMSKPFANIITFVGKKKELLLNVTNDTLIDAMFPGDANVTWPGKRICLRKAQTRMAGETKDCIRVCGSPDIPKDIKLQVRQGLRMVSVTLKSYKTGDKQESAPQEDETHNPPDEEVIEAWSYMGWTRDEGQRDLNAYRGNDYLSHLSALIDQKNAEEAS